MNERIQAAVLQLLERSRRLVLVLAVLGVALHVDSTAADILAPKAFWFGVAGGLLPALGGLRLWWGGRLRLPRPVQGMALATLAGVVTLSYTLSPFKAVSFGAWQAWLLALLLLFFSVDLLHDESARRWLLASLSIACGLAGLWSLLQRLDLDPSAIGRLSRAAFGPRVAGSLGNPNFAGGFFVLLLPPTLHQALWAEQRWRRRGASLAALLGLFGLVLSASKAALLGLGAAAAVGAHLLFWSHAEAKLRRRFLGALAILLASGLLAAFLALPSQARQRLLGGPVQWAESIHFRRLTWAGSVALAKARPLTGWGPGSFSVAYPPFRPPETMASQVQHSYEVSKPENWLLQVLAELGVGGLAGVLAVLGLWLWPLRERARYWAEDPGGAGLAVAVLAALAGSLVCNLASLDLFLPSTLLPFLFLMALGAALADGRVPSVDLNPENYARVIVSGGLALMATVPIVHAQLAWQSSRLLQSARGLSQAGRFVEAVPQYRLALDLDPLNLEARYFLAASLMDQGPQGWEDADEVYEELARLAPDYVLIHARRARLFTLLGRLDRAEAEWRRQLQLDPYLLQAVQELSNLLVGQGRLAEALQVLEQAAPRFPENADIGRNLALLRRALREKP